MYGIERRPYFFKVCGFDNRRNISIEIKQTDKNYYKQRSKRRWRPNFFLLIDRMTCPVGWVSLTGLCKCIKKNQIKNNNKK